MSKERVDSSGDEAKVSCILRESLAEFLGTAILMIFGMGSVAQFVLSQGNTGSTDQVRWAWGFGVMFGVYVSGGLSGGHLNPAVTLTLCLFGRVPWNKLLPYCLGQYLGSFTASCLVFGVYYDAFNTFKNGSRTIETAGIFATYPQDYLSVGNGLGDQIFGTAVLMLLVLALTDPGNMAPSKGYVPVLVGLIVVAIGMTYSQNCGYAINPARDLAPRLFTMAAGWGAQVFSHNNYKWFWIPIVGPHVGAILGGGIYELCINNTVPCFGRGNSIKLKICHSKKATIELPQEPVTPLAVISQTESNAKVEDPGANAHKEWKTSSVTT
nr:aquaporin-5 [Peronia verruculata]